MRAIRCADCCWGTRVCLSALSFLVLQRQQQAGSRQRLSLHLQFGTYHSVTWQHSLGLSSAVIPEHVHVVQDGALFVPYRAVCDMYTRLGACDNHTVWPGLHGARLAACLNPNSTACCSLFDLVQVDSVSLTVALLRWRLVVVDSLQHQHCGSSNQTLDFECLLCNCGISIHRQSLWVMEPICNLQPTCCDSTAASPGLAAPVAFDGF
jgi:hypothetical protein